MFTLSCSQIDRFWKTSCSSAGIVSWRLKRLHMDGWSSDAVVWECYLLILLINHLLLMIAMNMPTLAPLCLFLSQSNNHTHIQTVTHRYWHTHLSSPYMLHIYPHTYCARLLKSDILVILKLYYLFVISFTLSWDSKSFNAGTIWIRFDGNELT